MVRIYTFITPEGREHVLGVFKTEGGAKRSYHRRFAADWRGLAAGPLMQREPRPGEKLRFGDIWTEELARS